jgi:formylglycine-generating enzyme required for sulfatase activity
MCRTMSILISLLSLSWLASAQPSIEDTTVQLHNQTPHVVEYWIGDQFLGNVQANSSIEWAGPVEQGNSPEAHGLSITCISRADQVFWINSISLPQADQPYEFVSIVWGGVSNPDKNEPEKAKTFGQQPQYENLFKIRWKDLKSSAGGKPLRYKKTLIGTTFQDSRIENQVLAVHTNRNSYISNTIGMLLVRVPKGQFIMAMTQGAARTPITLSHDYYMAVTETTIGQFRAVKNRQETNESSKLQLEDEGDDKRVARVLDQPIGNILWGEAVDWCASLKDVPGYHYSLPTESQWEYACQAGRLRPYSPSGVPVEQIMWYFDNSTGRAHTVAQLLPNEYGLFDMHGNVMEWCSDWMEPLQPPTGVDPTGPAIGTERARRGGGFDGPLAWATSGLRDSCTIDITYPSQGFRVVLLEDDGE